MYTLQYLGMIFFLGVAEALDLFLWEGSAAEQRRREVERRALMGSVSKQYEAACWSNFYVALYGKYRQSCVVCAAGNALAFHTLLDARTHI